MSPTDPAVRWLVIGAAALVGLVVGSFLNVVVYRAPLGLSVASPRSFCPTCDRQLSWWENVPVVSWLALGGRCRTCRQAISIRYPLVEATTALVFGLVAAALHGSLLVAGYCVLAATALSIALIEYGGSRSPLSVAALGVVLGEILVLVGALWPGRWASAGWSLAGLAAGATAYAVLRARDPGCRDPLWHGRSILPVVGCWLGGLTGSDLAPVIAGAASWILAALACLAAIGIHGRGRATSARAGDGRGGDGRAGDGRAGDGRGGPVSPGLRVASSPLVTGALVAMAVSLLVAS